MAVEGIKWINTCKSSRVIPSKGSMLWVAIITTTNSLFLLFYPQDLEDLEPPNWSHTHIPARKTPQLSLLPGPLRMWLLSLKVFPDVRKKDGQSSPYIHTPLMMTLHLVSFSICLEFLSSISSFPILPLFYPGLPPAVQLVLKGEGTTDSWGWALPSGPQELWPI